MLRTTGLTCSAQLLIMSSLVVSSRMSRIGRFIHSKLFGRSNLLLTNSLISALMGTVGDAIQQNYDLLTEEKCESDPGTSKFNVQRSAHMTAAGFTTGLVSHYWYIYLDKFLGTRKTFLLITKKVLLDQIIFSPVNLVVYFSTLGLCERSGTLRIKEELVEKGFEQIYVVEWIVWPPMQFFNFYVLPLRYRILFDNIISLGFDIYSPYVKYKTKLKSELKSESDTKL